MITFRKARRQQSSFRKPCLEVLEPRSLLTVPGFVAESSGWITPPSDSTSDATGQYAHSEPFVTPFFVEYEAQAQGTADPPPPPPGQVRSTATADFPVASNPGSEFFLAVQGPGVVVLSGESSVFGKNDGITGGFPLFSRVTAGAGGSATLGTFPSTPLGPIGAWSSTVDVRAGDELASDAASLEIVEIPAAERWIKLRDGTNVRVKSTVTATTGGAAFGAAIGSWTAKFVPGNSLDEACDNAVRGAVFRQDPDSLPPDAVVVRFHPQFGLTLDETEALCGVDHFNWIQYVTVPGSFTVRQQLVSNPNYSIEVSPPIIDPIDDPAFEYVIAKGSEEHPIRIPPPLPPPDHEIYYWSEAAVANGIRDYTDRQLQTVTFEDRPSVGVGQYDEGEATLFETQLAGVRSGPTGEPLPPRVWSGLGTNFNWKSDAVNVSDVSFFYAVGDQLPPVASGGVFDVRFDSGAGGAPVLDPISDQIVAEGGSLSFTVTAFDPDEGDALAFSLDSAPEGATIDPATGAFTWTPADGPLTAEVTVRVTDDGSPNLSDTETLTITVNNVPPTVDAGDDAIIPEAGTFTGSGVFADPGADVWTATVNYGDGSGDQPLALNSDNSFLLEHVYHESGTFSATVTVTDDDGDVGVDTISLRVLSPQEQIQALIGDIATLLSAGVLNQGEGNALTAKLDAATKKLDQGNLPVVGNQLHAFINQVNALITSGVLSSEQGELLIRKANDIYISIADDEDVLGVLALDRIRA